MLDRSGVPLLINPTANGLLDLLFVCGNFPGSRFKEQFLEYAPLTPRGHTPEWICGRQSARRPFCRGAGAAGCLRDNSLYIDSRHLVSAANCSHHGGQPLSSFDYKVSEKAKHEYLHERDYQYDAVAGQVERVVNHVKYELGQRHHAQHQY